MDQATDPLLSTSPHAGPGDARPTEARAPALTPMMAQYFEIKAANPGYLLFYRMGDFYELFFEDAEIAAAALGIVLTKRGKHLGQDIEMCGVPIHAAQDYLRKLISLGHRVAVCEQLENPAEAKKRGAKSVVRRDVVRLVTAGTLTEDDLLPAGGARLLAALAMVRHGDADFALAWADVSTGETQFADLTEDVVIDELALIAPAELLLSETTRAALLERHLLSPVLQDVAITVPAELFDSEAGAARLRAAFPDNSVDPSAYSRAGRAALGALFGYVGESQKGIAPALRAPATQAPANHMAIDQATRASLELLETQRGEEKGSLRASIDLTVTGAGARLLARRLAAPLVDVRAIGARLDCVGRFARDTILCGRLRTALKAAPDLARSVTRLALERGGPRDLAVVGQAIASALIIGQHLEGAQDLPETLSALGRLMAGAPADLAATLGSALADAPPLLARDGGFVRKGFDAGLDAERALSSETRAVIAALEARLVEETGIKPLKIKHNGVLGYFLELPAAHGQKLTEAPWREQFIHRQTLANVMRFTTTELAELEGRIARASEAALEIELRLFAELRSAVLAEREPLVRLADALAELDVSSALGHLAATRGFVRPEIEEGLAFAIEGGRHPVVEEMVRRDSRSFVANDCDLSGEANEGGALWLVTGPNMGGKSTFLRQNALIAILAQMGAYVPAASARIGIVDRVFSRVGASDDIAHGRSTFMVEMVETAAILNRATRRSLVILDEIGRGTATFDGLSIAWATVESLHEATRCRALFATHFHELTRLSASLPRMVTVTMKVREWRGEVAFLHEVGRGAADRSYGIQVARLAGLPEPVLERARAVLGHLEARSATGGPFAGLSGMLDDLPLFAHNPAPSRPVEAAEPDPVLSLLDTIRPDDVSPREAIDLLYSLKKARDAQRRD